MHQPPEHCHLLYLLAQSLAPTQAPSQLQEFLGVLGGYLSGARLTLWQNSEQFLREDANVAP